MIIITANPAVDRTLIVPTLKTGEVNRSTRTILAAGGKGLNAARAVKALGGSALCMGFIGGRSGNAFARLAEEEGFRGSWTRMNGDTRTCIILVDESGEPTVINEPGPAVDRNSWETLHGDVLATYRMHTGQRVSHLVAFCGEVAAGSQLIARHSPKRGLHLPVPIAASNRLFSMPLLYSLTSSGQVDNCTPAAWNLALVVVKFN